MSALSLQSILMSEVETCGAEQAPCDVLLAKRSERCSCIAAVDAQRLPVGIFTERALVRIAAENEGSSTRMAEAMPRCVNFPGPGQPLQRAGSVANSVGI